MNMRLAIAAALLLASSGVAAAEEPSAEEMIEALLPGAKPGPLSRSWKRNRGVKVEGGQSVEGPPAIDLYVNFAFDSDRLATDSAITLDNLAAALTDKRLKKHRFLIGGHADAKGADSYNLKLSERRASAVKRYLMDHGVGDERLIDKGYGESELADPERPEDGVNRRVEVVNLSAGS